MAWYKAAEGKICPGSTQKVILGFLCARCALVGSDVRYGAFDEWYDTYLPLVSGDTVPSVVVIRILPLLAECTRDQLVRALMVPCKSAWVRFVQLVNSIQIAGRGYTWAPTTLPFHGLPRLLFPASASVLLFHTMGLAPLRPLGGVCKWGRSWMRRGRSRPGQCRGRGRPNMQLWSGMIMDRLRRASRGRLHAGACARNRYWRLGRCPRTREAVGRGPRRSSDASRRRGNGNGDPGCSR